MIFLLCGVTRAAQNTKMGCGALTLPPRGSTFGSTMSFGGYDRTFNIFIPEAYDGISEIPLVLSIHGWGGTSLEDACDSGLTAVAQDTQAFMTVHPQGLQDYPGGNPVDWGAWHFNGSTSNGGVSCDTSSDATIKYCYESNTNCLDCDWTDGADDVAFLDALLDLLEATYCIDLNRVYVSGQSNGGMMTYQLGASLSHRLAAIAPISGSMHWQHWVAPLQPIPVMAITGANDMTVPANSTSPSGKTSGGTWWYYSMDELASLWADAQECDGVSGPHATMLDGYEGLWCKTVCSNIDHVLCSWDGAHNYFSGIDEEYIYSCTPEVLQETYYRNGQLVWEFFSKHSKSGPFSRKSDKGA